MYTLAELAEAAFEPVAEPTPPTRIRKEGHSPRRASSMTSPMVHPDQRDPADVTPTDSYRRADPVWVFRNGPWRAGVIEAASARAAMVTYMPSGARGTGVDTLTARYVAPRTDLDPLLDFRVQQ
jgi:hypothetical protein